MGNEGSYVALALKIWNAQIDHADKLFGDLSSEEILFSAFDENTINGIIQSFVVMSDWPMIEQNIRVDLAVDVREQAKKIKAPTLSITGMCHPSILRSWLI